MKALCEDWTLINTTLQKWGIKADFKNKLNDHSIYF